MSGAAARQPVADDALLGLSRDVGGLQTAVHGLEKRMDRSEAAIMDRLSEHDESSKTGMNGLRQDVVHANTQILEKLDGQSGRISNLEDDKHQREGAFKLGAFMDKTIHKYAPWLVAGALALGVWLK